MDIDDATTSIDLAMSVAGYFDLSNDLARQTAAEVGAAVLNWRTVASRLGITERETTRMQSDSNTTI